jgi:hypothetical protein
MPGCILSTFNTFRHVSGNADLKLKLSGLFTFNYSYNYHIGPVREVCLQPS